MRPRTSVWTKRHGLMTTGWGSVIFGSEYQYEADEPESTTTSTTYQNKLTLTTPSIPAGNYRGQFQVEMTNDSGDKPVEVELTIDGIMFNEIFYAPKFEDEYFVSTGLQ